ncbi:MAG TPA: DMT family transporter [Hyphomonadaceae bacterium]|nr:DMT family transporter [Hyphomonadaceae bacterium]
MKPADFGLLAAVCLVWALNLVVTRFAVTDLAIPPLFFAFIRVSLVALVLAPFLLPAPRQIGTVFLISMGMAGLQFGFLFTGLSTASASVGAVIGQLGVPFTTILSIMFLGEQIGWKRGLGILMSFAGVMIIAFDADGFALTVGILYLIAAALASSAANILMKRIDPMPAMRLQAWIGLFSMLPLLIWSLAAERGHLAPYLSGDWRVYAASVFAVAGVSIFAHGNFYRLLKKYEVTLVSPLTLMTPVMGVLLGIILLGEPVTPRLIIGAIIAIAGVGVISVRRNRRFPEAAVGDKITQ